MTVSIVVPDAFCPSRHRRPLTCAHVRFREQRVSFTTATILLKDVRNMALSAWSPSVLVLRDARPSCSGRAAAPISVQSTWKGRLTPARSSISAWIQGCGRPSASLKLRNSRSSNRLRPVVVSTQRTRCESESSADVLPSQTVRARVYACSGSPCAYTSGTKPRDASSDRGARYRGGSGVPTTPVPAAQSTPPLFQYNAFSTTIG